MDVMTDVDVDRAEAAGRADRRGRWTARSWQQDVAVRERSARNAADDSNDTSSAAWEGLLHGLSECTR